MTVHEIGESKIGQTLQNGRVSAGTLREPDQPGRPCDPPEDQGTTADKSRSVELDSLRAIAALSVMAFHVATVSWLNWAPGIGGFSSHLNIGVTIFFLLTGFLLYRPFARSALFLVDPPSLTRYFRHRFFRIVPAYWVALTLLAIWPGLEGVFTSNWWVYYGFAQSYRLHWWFGGIGPAWSLSVEVAFYALMPLFALLLVWASRGRTPRARAHMQISALAVLALLGTGLNFWFHHAQIVASIPAHLLWFVPGMGMAVALARLDAREAPPRWLRIAIAHPTLCWAIAFAIYTGVALAPIFPRPLDGREHSPLVQTAQHVLYGMIATLVMLPAVFGAPGVGLPRRVLAHRSIAWLGTISYGIFLWHAPLLSAIAAHGGANLLPGAPFLSLLLPTFAISTACGWASHRLIERPAMRLASAPKASSAG